MKTPRKLFGDDWERCSEDCDYYVNCNQCRDLNGFVGCDFDTCCALLDPKSLIDYQEAYIHWKTHKLYSGCSHGN